MKKINHLDEHLVMHDATTIGAATVLGVAAAVITGEPGAGLATTGLLSAVGIGGMRVGPVRRTVNRAALAVAEITPKPEDRT